MREGTSRNEIHPKRGVGADKPGNISTNNRSSSRERFFIHGLWEMSRINHSFQTNLTHLTWGTIGDWGIDVGWCGGWGCYQFCPVRLLSNPHPPSLPPLPLAHP